MDQDSISGRITNGCMRALSRDNTRPDGRGRHTREARSELRHGSSSAGGFPAGYFAHSPQSPGHLFTVSLSEADCANLPVVSGVVQMTCEHWPVGTPLH
jgi:hypothetical protein